MKRSLIGLCLIIAVLAQVSPAQASATKTVGCAKVGYTMQIPAGWKVTGNCTWGTAITGGNPRFTIHISTTQHDSLTNKQLSDDCTLVLKELSKYTASYKAVGAPFSASLGGAPAISAIAVYGTSTGGSAVATIYEVFRYETLFQFLLFADVSGGKLAATAAFSMVNTMASSVHID